MNSARFVHTIYIYIHHLFFKPLKNQNVMIFKVAIMHFYNLILVDISFKITSQKLTKTEINVIMYKRFPLFSNMLYIIIKHCPEYLYTSEDCLIPTKCINFTFIQTNQI